MALRLFALACAAVGTCSVQSIYEDTESTLIISDDLAELDGSAVTCQGAGCGRRLLQDDDDDDDDDGPRAPPNPILAATPLTQQAAGAEAGVTGTITVVRSAAELYAALSQGSRHIDLRDHIDLTTLQIDDNVEWSEALLPEVTAGTQSITGSCINLPSPEVRVNITGVDLLKFNTDQCLIVTDADVFPVRSGNLWLDNVYIRIANSGGRDDIPEMTWIEDRGQLWLTGVTMQGTGTDQSLAVDAFSKVHFEDCLFADYGPQSTPVQIKGPLATAAFLRTTFTSTGLRADNLPPAPIVAAVDGAHVKMEDCTFEVAPGRQSAILYVDEGFIYSDEVYTVDNVATSNPRAATLSIADLPLDIEFLSPEDAWVTAVRTALNRNTMRSSSSGGDDSDGLSLGAIIGIVGACIGALLIACLSMLLLKWRRRPSHHEPLDPRDGPKTYSHQAGMQPPPEQSHNSRAPSEQSSHQAVESVSSYQANLQPTSVSAHTPGVGSPNPATLQSPGASPGVLKPSGFNNSSNSSPPNGINSMLATSDATNSGSQLLGKPGAGGAGQDGGIALAAISSPTLVSAMESGVVRAGTPSNGSVGGHSAAGSGKGSVVRASIHVSGASAGSVGARSVGAGSGRGSAELAPSAMSPGAMRPMVASGPRRNGSGILASGGSGGSGGAMRGEGSGNLVVRNSPTVEQNGRFTHPAFAQADMHGLGPALHEVVKFNPDRIMKASARSEEGVEERLARIQAQLDSTGAHHLLHGLKFKKGSKSRLQGGQAVVQFATDIRTERDYAIKFFATREAFLDEAALYSDSQNPLNKLLPRVREICDNVDGRLTDATGEALPPCIIMEKGEALNIWSRRNKGGLDHMTALQVLHHIAERLGDLHRAGYVHRDLKQSNVMWQPRRNRWTLIDFGLVATIGEPVQIGFSLAYAAPEVVRAYKNGETTVIANAAVDAWSLGVLAVELFTNDVALDLMQGKDKVISQIVGETPLPWEDPATAPVILKRFGLFKDVILELLDRDPDARPSMVDFTRSCRQVLALTTSNR